ncbi:MAG: guanosine monophosphate reductase [Candidatus Thorarchaeota archaeon]|jgi:IMP dehydrogenase
MQFELGLTFDDVLLTPNYTGSQSRADVDTTVRLPWHGGTQPNLEFKTPIISANMDTITGVDMAQKMSELGGFGILHRFCSIEDNVRIYEAAAISNKTIGVSVGVSNKEKDRLHALVEAGANMICVDVAHAHSKQAGTMVEHVRNWCGDEVYIIAGNVATLAGADYLSAKGADAVKVGIGPGSACSTRIKTGCGMPQLTAIMECSRVKCAVIADGGIRKPADMVKALAAGADMVMVGGMFAGTDETPGEVLVEQWPVGEKDFRSRSYKIYRGLASKEAQEEFMGQVGDWKTSEGVSFEVPCKGPVQDVIQDLMGGLRSGMTYCGSTTLDELRARAKFIRVTPSGFVEGTTHGMK